MIYISVGSPGSPKFFSVRPVGLLRRFIRFVRRIFFIRIYMSENHLRCK